MPKISPELIFKLREGSFADDLFITAVSHFDFFNFLKKDPSDFDNIAKSLNIKKSPWMLCLPCLRHTVLLWKEITNIISRMFRIIT